MSWFQSFLPAWKVDNQNTTQPDRRSPNTCEDRSLESRRHLTDHADVEARQTAIPSNLRLPSRDIHQRQTQLHTTHRISAQFNRDPFSCEASTAPVRHERTKPDTAHSVVSPAVPAAHVAHSVTAVRPVACRPPVPYTISYTQASKTVLLPTEHRVSYLAHHPPSATASSPAQEPGPNAAHDNGTNSFDNGRQPIRDRDPVPTATYADQLGATQATSQGATATTATADVPRAAAGGKGPSCTDGPTKDSEEDKIAKSAFYRNGRFTRQTLPNGAKREPLVIEKLPLRTFDGDVREYNEFRDDFIDLIEHQPYLSPQQKLQHLLAHLAGEPRAAVKGFELVPENYCVVLDLLEASYGDEGVIRNTLIRDFGYIPQPTEQPAELEKFLENAATVTRRLKRNGTDVDDTSTFYSLLMGHLPVPIRLKLIQGYGCRGTKKVSCVLDGLHRYLNDIKEAEQYAFTLRPTEPAEDPAVLRQHPPGYEEPGPPNAPCERPQQDTPPEVDDVIITEPAETSASAVNNSSNDHLKERRTCALCGSLTHFAANCIIHPTIQKRLRRAMKLQICLLCLRGGHEARVCPRRKKTSCKICGHGQHHRIFCKDADDNSRRKALRSGQMRAITGRSGNPESSDPRRHFRKKNKPVTRNVMSIMASATLRQGTQRSSSTRCKGNPRPNRKKRTRNQGANSKGQAGTARPSSNSSDERKQQTATASGNRRLLPARHGQLKTGPSSTTDGSAKFHREQREAEGDSSTKPSGGDSDNQALPPQDPAGSTALHSQTDAIYCASSTTEPTTLLECIKATAENPVTGNSRDALIFFDSGSNRSFVSAELARELNLPRQRPCSLRAHIFGSKLPSTIEGFSTSIVLRSKHRRLPPLAVIAGDCIVPSVRAALVEKEDLPKLRRNELLPSPIQVTPDILIGQDLVSHFKRQYGPTLPSGFYVAHSILGPMLGGSANVPTTAREAATSPKAANSACASHRTPTRTDETPPSPKLPPPTHGKQSPAHSVGSCNAIAKRSDSTLSVEQDLESPSDAAHQNFSQPVEKNNFYRSTTSTSCRTDRHPPSGCVKGSTPSRKLQNPLDTSAPLPPSTTHVTLQQELLTDPSAQTPGDYVTARPSHSSCQQNPALNKPRKTRLRRRSTTFGRTVLGTKNQRELRKCVTMRFLPDQPRTATDTSTHGVPGSKDPDAHYENTTFPGEQLPEVVYVAAAQPPIDRRQAAETPNSSSTARKGADSAVVPNPAHSVGREQAQEPRSTQKSQSTHAIYGANDDLQGAQGQPSPTSTGSGQRDLVDRRVSTHAQEGQLSRSARRMTSATAIHSPSIPIIDGFVSKSYATLLATSQDDAYRSPAVIEDLPPQNTLIRDFGYIPQPTEQPAELEKFLENAATVTRRLKRNGTDVDDTSTFYSLLMGHLPVPIRLKLIQGYGCRGTKKVSCVLDGLHRYLNDIKEAEQYAFTLRPTEPAEDPAVLRQHPPGYEEPGPPNAPCERPQQDTPPEVDDVIITEPAETSASAVNNSSNDHLKERRTCALCGSLTHFAANCIIHPTIQKRLRRAMKLQICLLCLRGGHEARVCPRRKKTSCKICGHGQHHRIFCKDADDNSRRKALRSGQMRAITGRSGNPESSDPRRHFRKKNKPVTRNVMSIMASATLRQGTQRSSSTRCKGNPRPNRKKRTRNQGANSKGQASTARPSSNSSDERKQQTATASGNRRLLPARHGQLKTGPSSTTDGSAKFHREQREAEGDSSTKPSGGDSDNQALPPQDPAGSTALHSQTDAIYCASSTTEPTTLLECIKATAENPVTGNSRDALIFFDSGSNRSFVSAELARELNLPRQRPCSLRAHIFGSKLPSTIEGFSTSIVLRSKHRRLPPLAVIAGDCIVPSVRAALVEKEDLPKLRRNELLPSPIQVTPDILIGQDLVSHFKRQYGPTLPSGFYVAHSILGPMLGGSANVPTTAREAATSPKAANSACASHRTPTRTDETPPSPKLPPPTHGKQSPAHSVGSCNAIAKRSDSTLSVEQDLESPSDAAHQNFSQPVEKNNFYRSTTSTSCRTDRHPPSGCVKGSTPSRKLQNPLDTSAPLPPSTTHVTLQQELLTDPSAQTPGDYVTARPSHSSCQQNPALNKPRKTRLRRRSTTFGRTVLGTKNQRELRKCVTMRFLPDQPRTATDTSTHGVPGSKDPDAHYENTTFPGEQLPEVVYVAAAQPPIDRRQAAETPNSSSTARKGADSAVVPNPAHSVGREQAQEPRSTQKSQSTHAIYGANDDLQGAQGQPSPTSTGSGQRDLVDRRVSTHAQEGQLSRSARRMTSATAIHSPSIPIIDGFVSKSYATLLATSQDDAYRSPAVIEDLPPQNTLIRDFGYIPQPTEQPAELEKFLENAATVTRRLKRNGTDVDDTSTFYSLLMGHLPVPIRLKLIQGYGCRGTKKVSCVLDGLHRYLNDIKEAEQYAFTLRPTEPAEDPAVLRQHPPGYEEPGPPNAPCERPQQDTPPEVDDVIITEPAETSASAVNNSSNDHLKERRTCALCGSLTHFAANCIIHPTIQKRLRRAMKLQICLLCLRGGHEARVCPRRKKTSCKICGHGQHHRIFCKDADDNSRRKALRSGQMRAITGRSGNPESSDPRRHFRKKNKPVTRNVMSIMASATLRQGTQRSSSTRCKGNPRPNRKKRTRNQGANSKGQAGTARPSSNSSDERKQQTATASGNRRLLPARHGQLKTGPSSTTDGSAKFHREQREAEGDSSTKPSGGDSDNQALPPQDPAGSTALHSQTDAIYCASSTTEPTTLLECVKATAENPVTGNSRDALIFFDSGSNRSFVSAELARELNLPRQRPCSLRAHIFGSKLPSTIEGFSTSIVLRSKHRRLPPLAVIAGDCIVPSVRAALVEKEDLPKLRRNELLPSPIQVTPDILIGQDLVSHFKRQYGPTLPSGFYVAHSILGPMLGGSANVPTTAREAATSPKAANSACASHRTPTRTDETPPSPKLPPPTHGKQSPAHSVGSCNAIAKRSDSTLSVEQDLESPSDAAHQNFSQPVEKNNFYRSTTSTSCRTDRHPPSGCVKGSTPSRKLQNPLDTSAPLPPSTTHVTLQQELLTDPSAQTPGDYVTARPSHSSCQQNPALNKPRKTRLRRRSTTFGRTVLGTKNQRELRKCVTMRFLPDQPRTATDTSTHGVPGSKDPDAHYENTTFPGEQLPEVVYVAAAQPPIDRRQAAETPNSSSTARKGADSAVVPNPAHSVGREQAQEPRSTQKSQSTHAIYGANDDLQGAQGQPSPTSTGSGQRDLVDRRVSTHAQEGQLSRSARRMTSATAIHSPSIPIIDGFVSKSYATLLATSQDDAYRSPAVIEDLPPQYEFVGSINHLGVPTSYLPTQFRRTVPNDDSPLERVTFDQLLQENSILPWKYILGSTLGALPPYWKMATADACLHLHEEAQGATYHGLPICGIGPTGFFLNAESNDTLHEYEGQRQALLRFGRIARNTGKCLVLVIYNEPKTGIDLHCEAIRLLCKEVQLLADHPIHLVAYRASAAQLLHWLVTFSNVVLGLDHMQLSSLIRALRSTADRTESYVYALQLQELFTNMPLKHLALHSGCPSTHPSEHPGHFQTPTALLMTAELFEQLTGHRRTYY